jgi:hypothetical protein
MYVMIYGADVPDALRAVTGRARVEVVLSFDVDEFSEKAEGSFSVGGGVRDITVKKVQTSDGQNSYARNDGLSHGCTTARNRDHWSDR